MSLRSNNNVVFNCTFHVVWCPKYRRKALTEAVAERLEEILREACAETNAIIEEMEIMPDHVHLLVDVDPQFGVGRLVKCLKGRSARALRSEFPWLRSRIPSLWTSSCFVSTTGGATLDVIKRYIDGQARS